jgi:hypothetical protein
MFVSYTYRTRPPNLSHQSYGAYKANAQSLCAVSKLRLPSVHRFVPESARLRPAYFLATDHEARQIIVGESNGNGDMGGNRSLEPAGLLQAWWVVQGVGVPSSPLPDTDKPSISRPGIRGTKSIHDVLTDIICGATVACGAEGGLAASSLDAYAAASVLLPLCRACCMSLLPLPYIAPPQSPSHCAPCLLLKSPQQNHD